MEVQIGGIPTEEVIEHEYMKGPGNMNLPPYENLAEGLYQHGLKLRPDMTEDEKKKLWTECQLADDKEVMSQLVDRLSSGNFQG
ncbi:MAG: hypothetical protein Q4F11_03315 [Eubacteriales bacterium]|nr:hypothetical protein [Eubacteriales bacterium]